jgi:hypothetical protein
MAKRKGHRADDDTADDADGQDPHDIHQPQSGEPQDGRVGDSPGAVAPPPEAMRPYEGGEPKRHPDTGEPQPVDDPPGDPNRPPEAGAKPAGGADRATRLEAENAALRKVVTNLGGNPDEVAKAATAGLDKRASTSGKKRWKVGITGHSNASVRETVVEADDEKAAVEEFQRTNGLWSLPSEPAVSPADEG